MPFILDSELPPHLIGTATPRKIKVNWDRVIPLGMILTQKLLRIIIDATVIWYLILR